MNEGIKKMLLRYGIFLFLLGLITGLCIPALKNPRMGVSAHLEGVMNGMFLIILGLLWVEMKMRSILQTMTFCCAVYGTYVLWCSSFLGAVFGTSKMTPLAGAGFTGALWQETIVNIGNVTAVIAMLVCVGLVLRGLSGSKE
jgi:hydroxylaminobenzene mutase